MKGECVKLDKDIMDYDTDDDIEDYIEDELPAETMFECEQRYNGGNPFEYSAGSVYHNGSSHGWNYCFHPNTPIKLQTGRKRKISDIRIGDVLIDGGYVTSTFKIAGSTMELYQLHDIIVTGGHKVLNGHGEWISVSNHPDAVFVGTPVEYIYCLNTTSKKIHIGEDIFMDWDEVDDMEMIDLKRIARNYIPPGARKCDVHRFLDSGFADTTMVELDDGRIVSIKEVEPNDVLKYGERVMGIVKIDATTLENVYRYRHKQFEFVGGPNIQISDNDLGNIYSIELEREPIYPSFGNSIEQQISVNQYCKPRVLYHLLTDQGGFVINGISFFDYNAALELWLDHPEFVLTIK